MRYCFATFLIFLVLSPRPALAFPIYGKDDRREFHQIGEESWALLSRSTAVMMSKSRLRASSGVVKILGKSHREQNGVCADEPFAGQLSSGVCSGFLISPRHLLTASHCMNSADSCKEYRWVFDHRAEAPGQKSFTVTESSVYHCQRIRRLDPFLDYAIIELSQEALDRKPFALRKSGTVPVGTGLLSIGYPAGLPVKFDGGARVLSTAPTFFRADLDAYSGSSGSPILNLETLEVEGILVRGTTDYVFDEKKKCNRSVVCGKTSCKGESVTNILAVPDVQELD